MQKKIIALAVAGLASTAAFAQTNVTIYGSVDYGYAFRFDNAVDNVNDLSAFNGGQAQGNRLGFKGTEDLGNGLKAVFLVEQGLGLDSSSNDASVGTSNRSISFTRQAYVGLAGSYGTLVGGRLYTPHFSLWSGSIDPFGAGTVGQYANLLGGAAAGDVVRVDNAVAYISPSFGGFTVTAAYSNKLAGQETVSATGVTNGNDTKIYALLGQFKAGGLDLGLNYHYGKFEGVNAVDNTYNLTLGGNYNFGFMKLHGAVAFNESEFQGVGGDNLEIYNYFLGATVPVGKVDLKASVGYSDADDFGTQSQYAVGANYNLSKRTDIYAAYSYLDTDEDRLILGAVTAGLGLGGAVGVGDAGNAGQGYRQGVQIGVRHKF
jgi:predicted porin